MQPRILILDDDPNRHTIFSKAAVGFEVHQTYAVPIFAEALQTAGPFDIISLDHDLGDGVNAGRQYDQCGCDAADLVVSLAPPEIPVLIHSANANCAQVMRRILIESGRSGRVSKINAVSVREHSEHAGIEIMQGAIRELIAAPNWPEDITPSELLDMLGDDPTLMCPVRAARR